MSQAFADPTYLTFEQYLEDDRISPHTEWVDGKVVPMHAVADRHDAIVRWLNVLLGAYITERELGRLFGEPFVMKPTAIMPGRSPDLMFVKAEHLDRVEKLCLRGPADLVIEVASPGSQTTDRLHKLHEYQTGQVEEYWLIDPEKQEVVFWRLRDGLFHMVNPVDGHYQTPLLPDASLRLDWFWQNPLPKTLPILRDWGLI